MTQDSKIPHDPATAREKRWETEAQFFDNWAEGAADVTRTDPAVIARYRNPGTLFHKEYRFRYLGDLTNRRVLDVGCGNGGNALILAELGARVVGIDISPKAIELAQRKAAISNLSDRCEFRCGPLETTDLATESFDIIWGDAILHHLIPELDAVIAKLVSWTRPGGVLIFSEPINFAPWLRKLRSWVPVDTDATPDERPLEPAEIEVIRRYLPDTQVIPFHLFGRLQRFVLTQQNYERSSTWRKSLVRAIHGFDAVAFKFPGVARLAGYSVIYGHRPAAQRGSHGATESRS